MTNHIKFGLSYKITNLSRYVRPRLDIDTGVLDTRRQKKPENYKGGDIIDFSSLSIKFQDFDEE